MQSGNIGKKIVDIRTEKKQIKVRFDSGETCFVDTSLLADFYLYKDKVLDEKTFQRLITASQVVPFKKYLYSLLSKGRYSEAQVRTKLSQRKAPLSVIYDLIQEAKKSHLIDDVTLAKDLLDYYGSKSVGIQYIEKQFKLKGFSKEIIASLSIPISSQKQSAEKQYDLLATKLKGKPYAARKQIVYRTLMSKGFEESVILSVIEKVGKEEDAYVKDHLKQHVVAARKKYEKKYKDWDLNQRIFNYLKAKGYNNKDIKTMLGDKEHDLD